MAEIVSISDVFRDVGQPTITYVERSQGRYERDLQASLQSGGQMALITGPSKTGKTTLYKRVVSSLGRVPLLLRCDDSLTPEDFWRRALETAGAARVSETERGSEHQATVALEGGGNGGWRWLAEFFLKGRVEVALSANEGEIRKRILAEASPSLLIPILKKLPFILVVEDFHYLNDNVKKIVFQQWKRFIDEEISIAVVGTTHHAVDIAYANKDLVGRINKIDVGQWEAAALAGAESA